MVDTRFDTIVKSYEAAIAKYPSARTDDEWLLKNLDLQSTDKVLEISGGTGFLTAKMLLQVPDGKFVVQDVSSAVLEVNKSKLAEADKGRVEYYVEGNMLMPALQREYFDKVISLGGFHHFEDPLGFVKGGYQVLKDDGILCVGDFADESPIQKYFDEVIHHITETGHFGMFMSESRMLNLARYVGFSDITVERTEVPFVFPDKQGIGEFFQMVHALDQEPMETYKDIERLFKIEDHNDGLAVMVDYVFAKYVK
jgi:ubiquinone/menaquinone biosynthesis C-methylase UbiE